VLLVDAPSKRVLKVGFGVEHGSDVGQGCHQSVDIDQAMTPVLRIRRTDVTRPVELRARNHADTGDSCPVRRVTSRPHRRRHYSDAAFAATAAAPFPAGLWRVEMSRLPLPCRLPLVLTIAHLAGAGGFGDARAYAVGGDRRRRRAVAHKDLVDDSLGTSGMGGQVPLDGRA
jgi:hypothetical protein